MEPPPPSPRGVIIGGSLLEGALAVVAVVVGGWLGYPPAAAIGWTVPAVGQGAAAALPLMGLLVLAVRFPVGPLRELVRVLDELVVPMFQPCRLWDLAMISLLAGLGEEMLFRGVIQEAVAGKIGPPWGAAIGLILAAVLFGMLHFITATYVVVATLMGMYLGLLWLLTGNLIVPITAHAVYDLFALVYLTRRKGPGP